MYRKVFLYFIFAVIAVGFVTFAAGYQVVSGRMIKSIENVLNQ